MLAIVDLSGDGELELRPRGKTPAPTFAGLTHTERYLFDTHGILTLRGALSAEEVRLSVSLQVQPIPTPHDCIEDCEGKVVQ